MKVGGLRSVLVAQQGQPNREDLFKECLTWEEVIRNLWGEVGDISGRKSRSETAGNETPWKSPCAASASAVYLHRVMTDHCNLSHVTSHTPSRTRPYWLGMRRAAYARGDTHQPRFEKQRVQCEGFGEPWSTLQILRCMHKVAGLDFTASGGERD